MNKITHCINHNRFIPVDVEELTALELISKNIEKTNEIVEDNLKIWEEKTNLLGDHKGSWQGLERPTLSEEGMRSTVEKLDKEIKGVNNIISILNYDVKLNDRNFDNSIGIQKAIDDCKNKGGGIVKIPNGKWYTQNNITIPTTVTLEGEVVGKPDDDNIGSSIICLRAITCILIKKVESDLYYKWSVGLKNIGIYGESLNGSIGVECFLCSYSRFENVHIAYFGTGIKNTGGMLDTYDNVAIFACTQYGIHYTSEEVGTTQLWRNLYVGQMLTGIPLKIEKGALIDITFERPTFESSPLAIESDDDNCNFVINDIYIENIPRTEANNPTCKIIKVGNNVGWKGTFTLNGGIILGNNTSEGWKQSTLFSFGQLNLCSINNLQWNRIGKVIDENTINLMRVKPTFRNCNSEEGLVITDLDNSIYHNKIVVDNCCVKSKEYGSTKILLPNFKPKWGQWGDGYGTINIKVDEKNRVVTINGMAKITGDALNTDSKILNIPIEYRPKDQFFFNGVKSIAGEFKSCAMRYVSTGDIEIFDGMGTVIGVGFTLSYNY